MSSSANTENSPGPVATFRQFVAAINRHDVGALTALMTPDHVFVDSVGNRVHGAASMELGWRGYFTMCRDYWIQTDCAIARLAYNSIRVANRSFGARRRDPSQLSSCRSRLDHFLDFSLPGLPGGAEVVFELEAEPEFGRRPKVARQA